MSAQPLRVLHLEDNAVDAELIRYHLEALAQAAGEPAPQITVIDTRAGYEAALAQPGWEVILADYRLPSYDGLSALHAALAQQPEVPFIFVTGELGEERAIETLRQGATDYVLKTGLGRLGPAVARARRAARDRAERREAQAAARESEGRFRILADHAPVMVWMADADGACDFFNAQWLAFTGRALEQEVGHGWLDNVHPDDLERVMRLDRAAVAQRRPNEMEYRLRRHDGEYRWVVDIGVPRYAPDGSLAGFIGSALDIHARKAAEAARRESEGRFRILADNAPVLVWMTDHLGLADFFNRPWLSFTGRPLDAEVGDGWTTSIHPADFERTLQAYRTAFAARQPVELEFQLRRADGEYRWVVNHAVPRYEPDGRFAGYIASGLDIHERKAAAQALRAARDQIAAILHGVAEGVTVQDAAGRLTYANDMAAEMLGYADADELTAARPGEAVRRFQVFDEQGRPFPLGELPGRRALLGEPDPFAVVRFRSVGSEADQWAEVRARPIFDADGRAVLAVNIFHDLTALKQAEHAQRLLADAGHLLGSALDEDHLANGLLQLLVPALADMGVTFLLEPDAARPRAVYTQADAAVTPLLTQIAQAYQLDPAHPHSPMNQVLRTGEALLIASFTEALAASVAPETAAQLAQLAPHSALLAPLRAHGRTLGVLVLARRQGPPYTAADLALAEELARRAALALENARLYTAAQQQAALLEARVHERTETLRQSQRRLAEAQQIASLGSWHWDIASDTVTWSEELYRIYGVDPAAFAATYESYVALVHPADREFVEYTVRTALTARRGYEYQHRIVRPDGAVRVLAARGEITLDAAGQPTALTGIARDVTDQLRIEAALHESREQLRQLSGHLQATREAERARISREIHDELGGALTGLKMDVARLATHIDTLTPEGVRAQTRDILALLDDAVKTVRRIATDLRPALLDDFGLAAAMEWQMQEFQKRSGLACTFSTNADTDSLPLPPEAVTALFRVFQETLTNVARHAQATTVTARLELTAEYLELDVQDNGRGISPEALTGRRSLGLLGMRERVTLLAGELRLDGAPGQGTRVLVRVPLAGQGPTDA